MAFIFRCENCNDEQETANSFDLDDMVVGCERCGQDGCENCITDDHCQDCQDEIDAEEAEEEEGDDTKGDE